MKIGVFDSGVGGLHVAEFVQKNLPEHQIMLKEDKENLPYGTKTPEELLSIVLPIIKSMVDEGCKVVVIACNTVTTNIIAELRQEIDIPLVGIEPMVKPASELTTNKKVAVCATPATLRSRRYNQLKQEYLNGIECIEPDCSDWATMIEANDVNYTRLKQILNMLSKRGVDVIVLGCTHYHWIEEFMRDNVTKDVKILQPEDAILTQLKRVLEQIA